MFSYSFQSDVSSKGNKPEEPLSSLNSLSHSDSLSFRRPKLRYHLVVALYSTLDLEKRNLNYYTFLCSPLLSGADSSSHNSPSQVSLDRRDWMKKEAVDGNWRKGGTEVGLEREAGTSSIEEEHLTAANDSLCSDNITSIVDDKGIQWHAQLFVCLKCCYAFKKTVPHIWHLKIAKKAHTVEDFECILSFSYFCLFSRQYISGNRVLSQV